MAFQQYTYNFHPTTTTHNIWNLPHTTNYLELLSSSPHDNNNINLNITTNNTCDSTSATTASSTCGAATQQEVNNVVVAPPFSFLGNINNTCDSATAGTATPATHATRGATTVVQQEVNNVVVAPFTASDLLMSSFTHDNNKIYHAILASSAPPSAACSASPTTTTSMLTSSLRSSTTTISHPSSSVISSMVPSHVSDSSASALNYLSPSKKLKRSYTEVVNHVCEEWEDYTPPNTEMYALYNQNHQEINAGCFDFVVQKNDKLISPATPSEGEGTWIIYRQNQFMITAVLTGVLANYSTFPTTMRLYVDQNDKLAEIDGLYFSLHAIKVSNEPVTGTKEERVVVHQAGASRTKKEAKTIEPTPFINGRASLSKLQFGSATANNARLPNGSMNPHQQYFKIIVCLLAKSKESRDYYTLSAKQSMKIIVRGQNPGRYNGAAIQTFTPYNTWQTSGDSVFHFGKVGINTENPPEPLSINGNLFITGEVIRPSDRRMKTNFQPVSTAEQLENIEKLKIYDYDIVNLTTTPNAPTTKRERGVIAQEVARDLPEAVQVVEKFKISEDKEISNCLVVSDRVLLFENIGATQQLDRELKKDQHSIQVIQDQVKKISQESKAATDDITSQLQGVISYLGSTPNTDEIGVNEASVLTSTSNVALGGTTSSRQFSLLDLGPAWSIFFLGFLLPLLWVAGFAYCFSNLLMRRLAGAASVVMLMAHVVHLMFVIKHYNFVSIWFGNIIFVVFGVFCFGLMLLGRKISASKRDEATRHQLLQNVTVN